MSKRLVYSEDALADPRCRKGHRPRLDFKSVHLGWFCETCHADLILDGPRFIADHREKDNPSEGGRQ